MIPLNDLSRSNDFEEAFFSELISIFKSGLFLNGIHTKRLEEALCEYVGTQYAIGVASGTAALTLALKALDLPLGSQVVLTANAGGYGRIAISNNQLTPLYIDVTENGLLDLDKLETQLNRKNTSIRAVIATHLYGQCIDLQRLRKIVDLHNIKLIEDCAQSIGAKSYGKMAGSVGDIATLSFYPTKNLGGIGDSGLVLTSDLLLANRTKSLKQYGWTTKYSVDIAGGDNLRIDEIQALAVYSRLKNLPKKNSLRIKIWEKYNESAARSGLRMIGNSSDSFVAHLAILDCGKRRTEIRDFMSESGISTEIHYPIPDHRQFAWLDNSIDLPETERQSQQFLTIPLFPEMEQSEIDQVRNALESVGNKYGKAF